MKLIIDIPEDVYEECQGHIYFPDTGGELFNTVKNGTPLDDIKAEIQAEAEVEDLSMYNAGMNFGLDLALEIIDNIGKGSEDKE